MVCHYILACFKTLLSQRGPLRPVWSAFSVLLEGIKIDLFHFEADLVPGHSMHDFKWNEVEKNWSMGQEEHLFKALSPLDDVKGNEKVASLRLLRRFFEALSL